MSGQVMISVWRKVLVVAASALLLLSGLLLSGTAHAADQLPQSHIYTPSNGGQVEVGESVLVSGGGYDGTREDTLQDFQVSVDGGNTWNAGYRTATIPLGGETGIMQALWAYVFTPEEPGVYTIVSRVDTDTEYGQFPRPGRCTSVCPRPREGPVTCAPSTRTTPCRTRPKGDRSSWGCGSGSIGRVR